MMPAYNYFGGNYANPYSAWMYPQNGFQNQPVVQQPVQVPQVQIPQSSVMQSVSPSGIIWISGMQEAQMYPVAPNNAVALWENSGKTIYLKQADATGKPTMRIYDLVERSENVSTSSGQVEEKQNEYATQEDVGKLVGVVKGLNDVVGAMKTDLENVKGDLYGIAGQKKKAVRKAEAVEDDA